MLMNTFIRQKAEETDRQTNKQTNNDNTIKQYERNEGTNLFQTIFYFCDVDCKRKHFL